MKKGKLDPKNIFHKIEKKQISPAKKAISRRKRIIRIMAIFGSLLIISGIVGSIICYLK